MLPTLGYGRASGMVRFLAAWVFMKLLARVNPKWVYF